MDARALKKRLPLIAFWSSGAVLACVVGMFFMEPPPRILVEARKGFEALERAWQGSDPLRDRSSLPWYYQRSTGSSSPVSIHRPGTSPGLNLVTRIDDMFHLGAQLETIEGEVVNSWSVDWFERWPNTDHIPDFAVPKSPPGTHLHGSLLLPKGNLVLTWEYLGTLCLAPDGSEVWRLPLRTHHSIHEGDDGHLWIGGVVERSEPSPDYPERETPYDEYVIYEVSPAGEVLNEWNVDAILAKNGLTHLVNDNSEQFNEYVTDDILHLNDAEPFPASMEPGFFGPEDLMVSLRTVHTVLVFNRKTELVTYISKEGMFTHQHDPDFIDGNTFSVYDNNTRTTRQELNTRPSRILVVSAAENSSHVYFEGDETRPFSSAILGKHQWLPNGNLLITDSMQGRAFELNPEGELIWERVNFVDEGVLGVLSEVLRVPAERFPMQAATNPR